MKKIESLTDAQVARFPEFVDKWMKIGLSTQPADRPRAEAAISKCYIIAGLKPPETIVWCESPLSNVLTRSIVLNGASVRASVWDSVRASVWASVGASVRSSVRASVMSSVWDSVMSSVWDSVMSSVRASVWASVRASVWDSVWDSVGASVWASVGDSVWDSVYGQHDSPWLSFYDYFIQACDLREETKKLEGLFESAKSCGWWIPHEKICWVSERHNVCKLNHNQIHCEDGPAIAYPDGFEIYGLNGVRVPKEIVMTPTSELDSHILFKEKNAEIRREIVRKIGIEKVCSDLNAKVMDTLGDYELLSLDLGDGRHRPYLKMRNPSIKVFHIEGVAPEIQSVQEALNWRNQTQLKPEVLS